MLAKLQLTLGDYEQYDYSLKKFKKYVDASIEPDKYTNMYAYLVQIGSAVRNPDEVAIDELTQIRKNFMNFEDKFHYFKSTIEIARAYMNKGMVNEAFEELSDEYFSELCILNHLFNAERNYMMGKISEIEPVITLKPAIEYYLTSFNILKESSITEITWQVMFEIGSIYFKRGNFVKAKEFLNYSKSLVKFIGENNIEKKNLRTIYLNQPERKKILSQIEELESRL